MIVTVEVEQRHIDEGVRGSCDDCPLAMALSELVRVPVEVHRKRAEIGAYAFSLPECARNFITRVDDSCYGTPHPFSFELEIPEQYLKPEVVREYAGKMPAAPEAGKMPAVPGMLKTN